MTSRWITPISWYSFSVRARHRHICIISARDICSAVSQATALSGFHSMTMYGTPNSPYIIYAPILSSAVASLKASRFIITQDRAKSSAALMYSGLLSTLSGYFSCWFSRRNVYSARKAGASSLIMQRIPLLRSASYITEVPPQPLTEDMVYFTLSPSW